MSRIHWRDALMAILIALATGFAAASPALGLLHGVSIDALTALRWRVFAPSQDPTASPAVVVAIDEETYRTPPFAGTPILTWTREIGRVLTAVVDGGAKVVGFDIIFPSSIEQSEIPLGDETLGERLRGFDRDFLRALAVAARANKIVLGQIQHQDHPISPSPGQRIAVGQIQNIRLLNVHADLDNVLRRMPLMFSVAGIDTPSMPLELASRALDSAPKRTSDTVMLAGYRVPAAVPNTMTLNFEGGANDIPTYSLADLRACVEKGDRDFFRRQFEGKVVLFGTVLDTEDRKLTSKRFATEPERTSAARCAVPRPAEAKFARDAIAGVYLHATAVNNLVHRKALAELGYLQGAAVASCFAGLTAFAAFAFAPLAAAGAYLGLAALWTGGATFAMTQALALPLIEPLAAGLFALGIALGYRFAVSDRDRRFLRQTFGLYLAPEVVEKIVTSRRPPALGGEIRNITAFFSDVAGYSTFAELMRPSELVTVMNTYLTAMTDIIEKNGGFVDKYIGDAIVAVFGAPLDDANHATHAVYAALECCSKLEQLNRTVPTFRGRHLAFRIGLNSGEALVGNIGSRKRFNYTVMGDAVNLASRLEGVNRHFGTQILASETTMSATGEAFAWRELDAVRVKGRIAPVKIYEPLAVRGEESPEQKARAAAYAEGLARWRVRDFSGAARYFARTADADPAAALFLRRAEALVRYPPGADWESVSVLEHQAP